MILLFLESICIISTAGFVMYCLIGYLNDREARDEQHWKDLQ